MVVSSGLHPGTTIAGYTPALIGVLPAESWQYLVRRSDLAHPLMVHAAPQRDRQHRLGAGNALVAELRIRLCNAAASYKSACVAIPAVSVTSGLLDSAQQAAYDARPPVGIGGPDGRRGHILAIAHILTVSSADLHYIVAFLEASTDSGRGCATGWHILGRYPSAAIPVPGFPETPVVHQGRGALRGFAACTRQYPPPWASKLRCVSPPERV